MQQLSKGQSKSQTRLLQILTYSFIFHPKAPDSLEKSTIAAFIFDNGLVEPRIQILQLEEVWKSVSE
jgi:hypothetical protein